MLSARPVHELNSKIHNAVSNINPQMVFCPFPDRHIDHRIVFDSVMVASRPIGLGRDIEILAAYETLSETHWNAPFIEPNFIPNLVIDIGDFIEQKIAALKCYQSQISKDEGPRSLKAVKALAQFRGSQSGFDFGEALYIIRMVS